jgi:hypothetical protein
MERRHFIRGLCSGVAAWPLGAYAQQIGKPRRIGVLGADATVWRPWIAAFASARLPTILSYGDYVEAGGLMSYGPDFTDLFRRAADMVDKILNGTKPGDIPVEQPTKFDFVINIKTATTLGLAIPPTLLSIADEVVK